jgi:hypothetical protein
MEFADSTIPRYELKTDFADADNRFLIFVAHVAF